MNTERNQNEPVAPAEAQRNAGRNLHELAEAMRKQKIIGDDLDVIGVFAAVTTKLLVDALGPAGAVNYLQRAAAGIVLADHQGSRN